VLPESVSLLLVKASPSGVADISARWPTWPNRVA